MNAPLRPTNKFREGSHCHRAFRYIEHNGACSTDQLAKALDFDEKELPGLLRLALTSGHIRRTYDRWEIGDGTPQATPPVPTAPAPAPAGVDIDRVHISQLDVSIAEAPPAPADEEGVVAAFCSDGTYRIQKGSGRVDLGLADIFALYDHLSTVRRGLQQ